jgi:hypothetical protein
MGGLPEISQPGSHFVVQSVVSLIHTDKNGSSGESMGNLRVSALGLSEEAVELAAGGVE